MLYGRVGNHLRKVVEILLAHSLVVPSLKIFSDEHRHNRYRPSACLLMLLSGCATDGAPRGRAKIQNIAYTDPLRRLFVNHNIAARDYG